VDRNEWSLFRYRNFLPVTNGLWKEISMGEGMTPIASLSDNVLVKADYLMPTLSFKDRGAVLVIWLAKTLGAKKVIQDSSGNAGNSIAAYAARVGMECEIYVPEGTSPAKIKMIGSYGADVKVLPLSRDETAEACREAAAKKVGYYASHVYNPFFYQGTKTYVYETLEQLGRIPDNLFIPVGNGTLFFGVTLALDELVSSGVITKRPKIYAVQSEHCAPILEAFAAKVNAPSHITPQKTMAEGIAVGQPARGPEILREAYRSGAEFISAPESRILEARTILAQAGYYVEHTTAATYAAYLSSSEEHDLKGDVLIPLCGAGLKSDK
jgi:threonine synthase